MRSPILCKRNVCRTGGPQARQNPKTAAVPPESARTDFLSGRHEQDAGTLKRWGRLYMEQFAPMKRSKDGQPVRYLVVDDSVFARKNLARMIETFGGQVAGEAGDGVTAITEYVRLKPDIVLMDITMPQMEGIEAAEKIVQQHPEARIVMVSSVGYQENIVAALQRGARHFVQKPVKPEVLYEVIKYVLGEDGAVANAASSGI